MTTEEVIRAAMQRCDRVIAGIEELRPFLDPALPLAFDDLSALTVTERMASIALLKRYEQLQDLLGRTFRAYLSWELEDPRVMTRRDQANQLEKFGIVVDADEWVAASELRNRLVHEYPLDETEQVGRVNDCWASVTGLIAIYHALRNRAAERGLAP